MKETFESTGPVRIDARVEAGSIEVEARANGTTEVEVEPRNDVAESLMGDVRVELRGAELAVETPRKRGLRFRTPEFAVRILCPEGSGLLARTASADVAARGRLGRLEVKTASGDVEAEDVDGEARLNTASGDVTIAEARGPVVLNSASGDLSIRRAHGRLAARLVSGDVTVGESEDAVEINSVSGDIRLERVASGSVDFNSVSGDAEIAIARGSAVYMDVRSLSGDMVSELEGGGEPAEGEAVIEVRGKTVSGDVRLASAG
jgi:DUF4097 and DUF4098 domain-containing protein YvlB